MAQMHTLVLNGQSYTVTDPTAARMDDTKVGADTWSSKNIIDRLCPGFSAQGSVVACQPVAGYPLEAVTHIPETEAGVSSLTLRCCGQNLLQLTCGSATACGITLTANGDGTFTANGTATADALFMLYSGVAAVPFFDGGMTLSGCPAGGGKDTYYLMLPWVGFYDYGNGLSLENTSDSHKENWTKAIQIVIKAGQTVKDLVFKPQIARGMKVLPYEPYRGKDYTVQFSRAVSGGSYDWTTGALTAADGTVTSYDPVQLPALAGENCIYSSTGTTEVSGRLDLVALLKKGGLTDV